jgi:hypothetical protein
MGKHSGPENQPAEKAYVENKAYVKESIRREFDVASIYRDLKPPDNPEAEEHRAEYTPLDPTEARKQIALQNTTGAVKVEHLAEYTNPIGRHAAERRHVPVPDVGDFYHELQATLDRLAGMRDDPTENLAALRLRLKQRETDLDSVSTLLDQSGNDPVYEQRARSNIDRAVVGAANFLSTGPFGQLIDKTELLEISSPNNHLTNVVTREIDAIFGADPNGQETSGVYGTQDGRPIDTYSTRTAFEGVNLLYQYVNPSSESGEAAKLRIWLTRSSKNSQTHPDTGQYTPDVASVSPRSAQGEAQSEPRPKRRLSLPKWMRRHKNASDSTPNS